MSELGPADRARDLADLAREEPSSVDPEELAALLDADAADARWYALQALRTAAGVGAIDLSTFVGDLRGALADPDARVRSTAAMAIGDVAARDPTAVADHVEPMTDLLSGDDELVRTAVTDYLYRLADAADDPDSGVDPAALEVAVADLRGLLEDPAQRENAVLALGPIADRYAGRLTGDVDAFREVFLAASDGPGGVDIDGSATHQTREHIQDSTANAKVKRRAIRNAAGRALVAVAREDPTAVVESLPALADALEDPNPDARSFALEAFEAAAAGHADAVSQHLDRIAARLEDGTGVREHATLALAAVSQSDPDAVVEAVGPYHDAVVDLLGHQSPAVRGAAVGLLSYLAEESPGSVDPGPVRPLLDDDEAYVRGNAAWVLGYLEDEEARAAIAERAADDPDPEVRSAAEAALDRL